MQNVLKNSARRIGELRRTNVRGVLLAGCLVLLATAVSLAMLATQKLAANDPCQPGMSTLKNTLSATEDEYRERSGQVVRANWARFVHDELFWLQPNVYDVSTGFLRDGKGGWTEAWGITVWVTERVDQLSLPPDYRIPSTLDGVPVQVVEEPPIPADRLCGDPYKKDPSEWNRCVGRARDLYTESQSARFAMRNYEDVFERRPDVYEVTMGFLRDDEGGWTNTWGINVWVTEMVDQKALRRGNRIPSDIDGAPVKIVLEGPPVPEATYDMAEPLTEQRVQEVLDKYRFLFLSQPHSQGASGGLIWDGHGEYIGHGISVSAIKRVDPSRVPPRYRLPHCLEGVPVQFEEFGLDHFLWDSLD